MFLLHFILNINHIMYKDLILQQILIQGYICIDYEGQCSTTGITKAMGCAILSVGWCM